MYNSNNNNGGVNAANDVSDGALQRSRSSSLAHRSSPPPLLASPIAKTRTLEKVNRSRGDGKNNGGSRNRGRGSGSSSSGGAVVLRRVREHHFPVYSHPMFRAAALNEAAVRSALDAQVAQIDVTALDDAVEDMVERLLRQQALAATTTTAAPTGKCPEASPVVSEAQLLALLDRVSHIPVSSVTAVPQEQQQREESTPEPPNSSRAALTLPDSTFISTTGLPQRPLPQATRWHQPPATQALMSSAVSTEQQHGSSADEGDDARKWDDVRVVSVNALQKAALACTQRASQAGASPPASSALQGPQVTPYSSCIPHDHALVDEGGAAPAPGPFPSSAISPVGPPLSLSSARFPGRASRPPVSTNRSIDGATGVSPHPSSKPLSDRGSAAAHTQPKPGKKGKRMALYSFLPTSAVENGGSADGGGSGGCVDTSQIAVGTAAHGITFAEMDRRPGVGTGPVAQQSLDARALHNMPDAVFAAMDVLMDGNSCCVRRRQRGPGLAAGRHPNALRTSTSFKTDGASLWASSSPYSMRSTLPLSALPPPPRTAAEAKARRILDAQRRRRRFGPLTPPPAGGTPRGTASLNFTTTGAAKTQIEKERNCGASLPPLPTTRGMASASLCAQALRSARQSTGLYK